MLLEVFKGRDSSLDVTKRIGQTVAFCQEVGPHVGVRLEGQCRSLVGADTPVGGSVCAIIEEQYRLVYVVKHLARNLNVCAAGYEER